MPEICLEARTVMSADEARSASARIRDLSSTWERSTRELGALLDEFSVREGWREIGYGSMRHYLTDTFSQERYPHLTRLLAAAKTLRELGPVANGNTPESHLRPLSRLESGEAKREALTLADERAAGEGRPRQARDVKAAVEQVAAPPAPAAEPEPPKPTRERKPPVRVTATQAPKELRCAVLSDELDARLTSAAVTVEDAVTWGLVVHEAAERTGKPVAWVLGVLGRRNLK